MTEFIAHPDLDLKTRAAAVIEECLLIATMTEEPGRTTRRFLTAPVAQVHAHLRQRMEDLSMEVTTDAAGNLRGVWNSRTTDQPRLVFGSHIDTVPDAGAFDGVLGVVLALEWVRIAQGLNLRYSIEVIAFSEEEGVRFGVPFIGSRAVAGTFDLDLNVLDLDQVSLKQAIENFGLEPREIAQAVLDERSTAFIEIHIEQGPVLEAEGLQLAVVEGIVGQTRLDAHFTGHANHAGTTPMRLRYDALAAAAEWIIAVEATAKASPGLVATVGKIQAAPNAVNVVPGAVEVSLDVRHLDDTERLRAVASLIEAAESIAARRGVTNRYSEKMAQSTILLDATLITQLLHAMVSCGHPAKTMPSGAGHDAMILSTRVPTAMLFLRSPGGISHHPDESVLEIDVQAALEVGEAFLQNFEL